MGALTLLAACGGSGSGQTGSGGRPAPCVSPPEGVGPDAAATLGDQDNGKTICLRAGEEMTVFLRVPPAVAAARWSPVESSDTGVLRPVANGALTLPIGVTGAAFKAERAGVARLSSSRPGTSWQTTVDVGP